MVIFQHASHDKLCRYVQIMVIIIHSEKHESIVMTLKWLNIQLMCEPLNEIIVQKVTLCVHYSN